jgi:hypothetical protein
MASSRPLRETSGLMSVCRGCAALLVLLMVVASCRRGRAPRPAPPLPDRAVAAVFVAGDGDGVERDTPLSPRPSSLWDGRTVKLFAARNEIVAFQVVVRAGARGISALAAALPELSLPGGGGALRYAPPAADPSDFRGRPIQLFSVGYMNVERPTEADFIYHPGQADAPADPTGAKPVQLIPENARPGRGGFPLSVRPGDNQSLWFEIYTGKGQGARPPGIYKGTITIRADDQRTSLPVELELLDLELPDESPLTAMLYFESEQPEQYQGTNLDAVYHRFAHRQRVELVHGYDLASARAVLGRFTGEHFSAAAGYEGPGQGVGNRIVPASFYGPGEGWDQRATAWARSDAWITFLEGQLPRAITFLYMVDEPSPDDFPGIRTIASHLQSNPGPGRRLRTFVTRQVTPELAGAVGIWCATGQLYDLRQAASERAAGREHWLYNGGRPGGPAAVIDTPVSDPRVIGWAAFKAGIPVYFHWHAVHWKHNSQKKVGERLQDVWANPVTFDIRKANGKGEFANGEGVLLYPGTEKLHPEQDRGVVGPISTLRLANLRRGLQDHLYLTMARERGHGRLVDELLRAIVPRVFSEVAAGQPVGFPQESEPFEQARRRLARALTGPASPAP